MKSVPSHIRQVLLAMLGMSLLQGLFCAAIRAGQEQNPTTASPADGASSLTTEQRAQLDRAQQLFDTGKACSKDLKHREAKQKFLECLRIRKAVLGDEDLKTASTHAFLANVCVTLGDYSEASQHYDQALLIIEKKQGAEHADTALALNNAARANALLGDDDQARQRYEKSIAIRVKLGQAKTKSTANTRNSLASAYRSLGDYTRAEQEFKRSLEICGSADSMDKLETVKVHNNMAVLYLWWGQYDRARRKNRECLELLNESSATERSDLMASCLYNEGLWATMTGDNLQAESSYLKALEIFMKEKGKDHPSTARAQSELGLLHFTMGGRENLDKAQSELQQSLEVVQKRLGPEHREVIRIRANLGLVEQQLGNKPVAEKLLKECLESRIRQLGPEHSETAASHLNLGQLYENDGEFEKAASAYASALAIHQKAPGHEHCETAASLDKLGLVEFALGRPERARQLIGDSLAIRRTLLDVTADVQSERQQLQMNQSVRSTLDDWLSLTALDSASAYAQALRWKGTVFVRQKALRDLRHESTGEMEPLVAQLRDVSCRLAKRALNPPGDNQQQAYQADMQNLSAERELIEAKLSQKSPARRQSDELAKLTPEALRTAIPPQMALVDFLEYDRFMPPPAGERTPARRERHFVAFVVRPDRPEIQRVALGAAEPIDELVDDWHRQFERPAAFASKKSAQELYRRVWLPLEPYLGGVETVLISPDGSLSKLPFAALPAGENSDSYLLEKIALATIPVPQSLLALLGPNTSKRAESAMLVMGGINYEFASKPGTEAGTHDSRSDDDRAGVRHQIRTPLQNWAPLPGTRDEGAAVQDNFQHAKPEGSVRFLQDNAPTEELIKQLAPQYDYLHFATHGYFAPPELRSALDNRHDLKGRGSSASENLGQYLGFPAGALSGLALAGANKPGESEDGLLTALEVEGLDLSKAQLVVLSACETGLGRVAGGEGVLGLQRSFQLAGARTVVATLWKVDDQKTRDLMGKFYEFYWKAGVGKLSTIECLRQAQLQLLNSPPDDRHAPRLGKEEEIGKVPRMSPKYWAAFVLSGDWR